MATALNDEHRGYFQDSASPRLSNPGLMRTAARLPSPSTSANGAGAPVGVGQQAYWFAGRVNDVIQAVHPSERLRANKVANLVGALLHKGDISPGFDIESEQRLRIGTAQIEAPMSEICADAIGLVNDR